MMLSRLPFAFASLLTGFICQGNAAISVASTVLVLARELPSANSATSGLQGYGIPYDVVLVPQSGVTLPPLSSSGTEGSYGGIVVMSEVAYRYDSGWASALTTAQWQTLYEYQAAFGARMVRLDAFPAPEFGTSCSRFSGSVVAVRANCPITGVSAASQEGGCCNTSVEQLVSISNSASFPTANIKT